MKISIEKTLRKSYALLGAIMIIACILIIVFGIIVRNTGNTDLLLALEIIAGIEIVLVAVGMFLILRLVRTRISEPVVLLKDAAHKISKGEFDSHIVLNTGLEFDDMAEAFNAVADSNKATADYLSAIAGGDFTHDVAVSSEHDVVARSLSALSHSINSAFTEIASGADEVNNGGAQVSSASMSLSQGAAEQAGTIEELSATINEVRNDIVKNAEYASNAYRNAELTRGEVESGAEKMNELLKAMDEINQSTDEIARFIKVIEDIAFQTNILALNASVEAARAGEAGKGFAVVATEVKNLATKSQEAAQHTNTLISNCVDSVKTGVEKTNEAAGTFSVIAEKTNEISGGLNIISDACSKQSEAITQINVGVEQISSVVQNTSATAQQCAASAVTLTDRSGVLRNVIGRFKYVDVSKQPVRKPAVKAEAPVHNPKAEEQKPSAEVKKTVSVAKKPENPVQKKAEKPAAVKAESVKTAAKPEVKKEAKQEPKPEIRKEIKKEVKQEPKPEVKKEFKQEPKPEIRKEAKPEIKRETLIEKPVQAKKPEPPVRKPAVKAEEKTVSYATQEFVDIPDNKY